MLDLAACAQRERKREREKRGGGEEKSKMWCEEVAAVGLNRCGGRDVA
jgi:hypothetical protein